MEFSLAKIVKAIIANLWIIMLSAFLLGGIGFAYSRFYIPPTYTSSMKMMVTSEEAITNYTEITAMRRMVNTYIEMLNSRDFYQEVKKECDLEYSATQLQSMVSFTPKEDSEAFTAKVVANTPEECYKIINCIDALATEYVANKYNKLYITTVESPNVPYRSSRTPRNTALAFLIGLFFSSVVIIIIHELDTRIKSEKDLTSRYDYPILGIVPSFNSKSKSQNAKRQIVTATTEVKSDEKKD